ncbi:MAG: hypothetical protein ACREUF_02705, partial [Solimonas sp.]
PLLSTTGTASLPSVCRAVFGVVNGVQIEPRPADRLLGIAACLLLAARAKGFDLSEVMNQAGRVLHDANTFTPTHMRAVQDYVRNEL